MSPDRYVPFSVRYGGRRARLGWKAKGALEALALWLAPWLRPAVELAASGRSTALEATRAYRFCAALVSIQSHGMLDDNAASMVWTARVALNPEALAGVPEHLRAAVEARFAPLPGDAQEPNTTTTEDR